MPILNSLQINYDDQKSDIMKYKYSHIIIYSNMNEKHMKI